MAEKIIRQLVDDLDGTEIAEGEGERIEFSLQGVEYQIDLSSKNVQRMINDFAPYVDAAEKIRRTSKGVRAHRVHAPKTGARSAEELANIRDWAKKNGLEVSNRGRVAGDILAAFDEAHKPKKVSGGPPPRDIVDRKSADKPAEKAKSDLFSSAGA